MQKKSFEEIRDFWDQAANSAVDADGLRSTARDPFLQLVVEDAIESHLQTGGRLLDVGCGDGLSTLRFAAKAEQVLGVDYTDGFIAQAKENARREHCNNVEFEQGDVLDLSGVRERHAPFDTAVSIRCLINLPEWGKQKQALGQIADCIAPGGLYICSEGWEEGWDALNVVRVEAGLDAIDIVPYNRLIKRSEFEDEARRYFDLVDYHGLGLYLFMSRVVQAVVVKPEQPHHRHPINKVGCDLQRNLALASRFDNIDYAGVYIFRKK